MRMNRWTRGRTAGAMLAGMALLVAACGGGEPSSGGATTGNAPTITVVNETPCVINVRFDNGYPRMRIAPNATETLTDPELATYQYMKAESTMAIFRTFPMEQVRADNWTATVRAAADDRPCVHTQE